MVAHDEAEDVDREEAEDEDAVSVGDVGCTGEEPAAEVGNERTRAEHPPRHPETAGEVVLAALVETPEHPAHRGQEEKVDADYEVVVD